MPRLIAIPIILLYVGILNAGIISQTLGIAKTSHPVMYYVLWDMFCGWSGYETRVHMVAEGVSGAHYQLNPAPWGDFQPYGSAQRIDYDYNMSHSLKIAQNILDRTEHEPIRRIHLIEENWSKRYNRPEYVWNREFEERFEPHSYFYVRATYDAAGGLQQGRFNWSTAIMERELASDPRLAKIRQQGRSFFVPNPAFANSQRQTGPMPGHETYVSPPSSQIQPASYSVESP